jgi:hypothetical protein
VGAPRLVCRLRSSLEGPKARHTQRGRGRAKPAGRGTAVDTARFCFCGGHRRGHGAARAHCRFDAPLRRRGVLAARMGAAAVVWFIGGRRTVRRREEGFAVASWVGAERDEEEAASVRAAEVGVAGVVAAVAVRVQEGMVRHRGTASTSGRW